MTNDPETTCSTPSLPHLRGVVPPARLDPAGLAGLVKEPTVVVTTSENLGLIGRGLVLCYNPKDGRLESLQPRCTNWTMRVHPMTVLVEQRTLPDAVRDPGAVWCVVWHEGNSLTLVPAGRRDGTNARESDV